MSRVGQAWEVIASFRDFGAPRGPVSGEAEKLIRQQFDKLRTRAEAEAECSIEVTFFGFDEEIKSYRMTGIGRAKV